MTASVYLLSGESFLAEEALARVREEAGTDPLSDLTFDPAADTAEIIGALQTPSLLGGRRLVVIHDAEDLDKERAEALAAYVESPSPSSVLVLVASGRTKLDAAVKKHGAQISLEAPKGRRLVTWLKERARERRLALDDKAAWALLDAVGPELRGLDGALEQLSTSLEDGTKVGVTDIKRAFPRLADERVYAFTDAVGERRLPVAMGALRRLLEQGDEPLVLFGALSNHLRRLLRVRRIADQGKRGVAEILGMPDWRAERLQRQALAYKESELLDAVAILAETDVEMKGEFPSPEMALERAVIQIVVGTR